MVHVAKKGTKRGDTLVEVMFSITIFALIAVMTVNLMNMGISTVQSSLETTMARNEIDAQAEALRFIQNSYLAEKELNPGQKQFTKLWQDLIENSALPPSDELSKSLNDISNCSSMYGDVPRDKNYFVLNTRLIQPELKSSGGSSFGYNVGAENINTYDELLRHLIVRAGNSPNKFQQATLFPRIVYSRWGGSSSENSSDGTLKESGSYREISAAEGIWVVAVRSDKSENVQSEYYDFYIRTCWNAPGRIAPSTIGTIIRLYNPEVID